MKCVPVHHGIPAVLHRDEPWLHRHSENGALTRTHNACLTCILSILYEGLDGGGGVGLVFTIQKNLAH